MHSENFQALQLLQERYKGTIDCIYIDPPFNTGEDDFPYKDNFQHSSWMSMMFDRINISAELLSDNGIKFIHIGDDEASNTRLLLEATTLTRKNSVVVRRGIKNVQAQFKDIDKLSLGHDTIHVATKHNVRLPHLKQSLKIEKPGKWDTFWRGTDRATMRYELFGINPSNGQWRWEPIRAKRACENYEYFLGNESPTKTMDEWYIENLQAGIDLDFVRQNEEGTVQYYVPPQASKLVSDNWLDVAVSGNFTNFPHEKSLELLTRVISWNMKPNLIVLDYFGGSGTTAHAVLEIHKTAPNKHKYIIAEMGSYFDNETMPRIKRAIYGKSRKNDKPVGLEGISHCFKYIRLESYEDTLNNLDVRRSAEQELALEQSPSFREGYLLKYMLEVESRESLLNTEWFINP
ncbi:MAG: site-specific DNA-methyltransferase, partial [Sphingobacteriales bacterium]